MSKSKDTKNLLVTDKNGDIWDRYSQKGLIEELVGGGLCDGDIVYELVKVGVIKGSKQIIEKI